MEKIIWDEGFSVGVSEMDRQHRRIIDIINSLIEKQDIEVDSEIISDTLIRMLEYANEHFRKEEQYMLEYDYPGHSRQREEHNEFRKRTAFFSIDTIKHKTTIPKDVLAYLKEWWVNHILKADMKYKTFFVERGVK
ncbi:MAG: hemerythrin-like metal-binding protein [Deltaproteobacteria bacterium]|nr:hemerythrin-like metal-binding protein [Deltaproteobacteria bacterium]